MLPCFTVVAIHQMKAMTILYKGEVDEQGDSVLQDVPDEVDVEILEHEVDVAVEELLQLC